MYIENSKAIIRDGTPEEKQSAIDTLYTALEGALTMIHPFMPFLTEELWQRLPRRPGDNTKSIVVAAYPEYDAELDDPTSERAYDFLNGCAKGIRSLFAEYGVKEGGRAYVQPLNAEAQATAGAEAAAIKSLAGKALAEMYVLAPSDSVPSGVAVYPVSVAAAVFIQVPGTVDPDKEIKRAQGKLSKTVDAVRAQEKEIAGFGADVGAEVRQKAEARLQDVQSEQSRYEESLARFQAMKL